MLNYSLHDNALTKRANDMWAQTHPKLHYDRKAFINLMLERGTLISKTDIIAVLNHMEETAAYIVENGGTLKLPLFNTNFSISGVFEGANDAFDPTRHKLCVNVVKGTVLRKAEQRVKLSKANISWCQPQIHQIKDSISGSVDTILTAGGAVEILGIKIKLLGDKPETGLYFVAEDGTTSKAEVIIRNKPSQIIALIPALKAGRYRIKVVTQFTGGRKTTEPKVTYNTKPLLVS
ncbi:MAG: DUF4469 domain-containing protein [Prevotellaceae bacterium]|jgi:hypothetical protein|nr:DUF4469 domain-containing protein [Prevotellaceae bacterium]